MGVLEPMIRDPNIEDIIPMSWDDTTKRLARFGGLSLPFVQIHYGRRVGDAWATV
jgi:hypothetical protein